MPNLAQILSQVVDGLFVVDSHQRIVHWNDACSQMLGIPGEAAMGRPCHEVVAGRDAFGQSFCRADCILHQFSRGKLAPGTFRLRVPNGAGSDTPVSVSIVLVPNGDGNRWAMIHLLHWEPVNVVSGIADELFSCGCAGATGGKVGASKLTAREKEILSLVTEGAATKAIALRLGINVVTVRNHIQHIQSKLCVHSRSEMVAYAYRYRLVGVPAVVGRGDGLGSHCSACETLPPGRIPA
jgi:PAS domain S-box-containing protein